MKSASIAVSQFQWKKLGQVFDPAAHQSNWAQSFAQAPSVIIGTDYVRTYFASRGAPDENGQFVSRLGYVDLDRENLLHVKGISPEPVLGLGELGAFDEFGTNPASVVQTPEHLRIYYAGWTRMATVPFNAAIGVAESVDGGQHFTKLGAGPVLCYTPDEPFVIGSPKIRYFNDEWILCYSCGRKWIDNNGAPQPVYKIRMARSNDGLNWQRVGCDLIESVLEEDECQASPDIFYSDGTYHMFFSYRHNLDFKTPGRGYRFGYAHSTNLIDWRREDQRVGIVASESGWDSESISYGHVFQLDGSIFMLYQGNEIGRTGFGLAQLETPLQ